MHCVFERVERAWTFCCFFILDEDCRCLCCRPLIYSLEENYITFLQLEVWLPEKIDSCKLKDRNSETSTGSFFFASLKMCKYVKKKRMRNQVQPSFLIISYNKKVCWPANQVCQLFLADTATLTQSHHQTWGGIHKYLFKIGWPYATFLSIYLHFTIHTHTIIHP
jgi:hypothetical protein